jgi:hypothetical protein
LGHGLVAAINELNEFGLVAVFCDEGMLFFFLAPWGSRKRKPQNVRNRPHTHA